MKYLRKFATEAEIADVEKPAVVLINDTYGVKYYPKPKNGVYIQHIDGNVYSMDDWTAEAFPNASANGVAVVSNECAFVIAKTYVSSTKARWGGHNKVISGISNSPQSNIIKSDYDGKGNTAKIIEQLNGYTDTNGVVGAPAAEACANYLFPNGKKGYLPSAGEWVTAYKNKAEIIEALTLIGGVAIVFDRNWSSTQTSATQSCAMGWDNGGAYSYDRNSNYNVRPFTTL